jgi:hypothetical protein
MNILIATNNFWPGGRETFTATWLRELKVPGSLIASSVNTEVPEVSLFDEVVECGTAPYADRLRAWLERGAALIERRRPSLIWAHHFELLPAWLLSRIHQIPLLTTFHGPLIGARRPNDLMQALGMTLAIHRGDAVSGVSDEILDGLRALNPETTPLHIPNTVSLAHASRPPAFPPRRFVMITRRDKLGHIREGARLFALYARHVRGCELVVADGEMQLPQEMKGTIRGALRQLGLKWAFAQGPSFVRHLSHMKFIGWTGEVDRLIQESDVVLGMGRVVLEGLSHGRPAVLVGYDRTHDLITMETFGAFRASNFSGRGAPSRPAEAIAGTLRSLTSAPNLDLGPVSAEVLAPELKRQLLEISGRFAPDPLAGAIGQLLERTTSDFALFATVAGSLSEKELETLYRVAEG